MTDVTRRRRHLAAVGQVWNPREPAGSVIAPSVVAALKLFAAHHAEMQWELTMRASIFDREDRARFRSDQYDWLASE
jgi:hypothetical protein